MREYMAWISTSLTILRSRTHIGLLRILAELQRKLITLRRMLIGPIRMSRYNR